MFLHYFTEDWEDADRYPGTEWRNCEVREFSFESDVDCDEDGDASLFETVESRQRREKLGDRPGRERQSELFTLAMEGWEKQGLQRPDKLGAEVDGCAIL